MEDNNQNIVTPYFCNKKKRDLKFIDKQQSCYSSIYNETDSVMS